MLPVSNPTHLKVWADLQRHQRVLSQVSLRSIFHSDSKRFDSFHLEDCGLLLDYSKNIVQKETLDLLSDLAEAQGLAAALEAWSSGAHINVSEDRAVLHQALRSPMSKPFFVDGVDLSRAIQDELDKMSKLCNRLHSQQLIGFSGKPIDTVVNIGIGGSDLGGKMVCEALRPFHQPGIRTYFVSNLDAADLLDTLSVCDPARTLFLIASKTFTTAETLSNASLAKDWVLKAAADPLAVAQHFVALSTAEDEVKAFGISPDRMFRFWDWVGGRYSLWSSIGLSIACTVGWAHFKALLAGAHQMDQHFLKQPTLKNMPVILSLLSLWYRNFFQVQSHALLSYAHHLRYFVPFLQQLVMESNGKFVDRSGKAVNYPTSPIIWGGTGTNAQHSFHQLLHQGTDLMSCDFIGVVRPQHKCLDAQQGLLAHCLAQSRALMWGQSKEEARTHLEEKELSESTYARSLPYRVFLGGRPSNTILLQTLNPKTLGALIALYEHKTFCEGILWNIYSFDQWGVELGKMIAQQVNDSLHQDTSAAWDSSTAGLIEYIRAMRSLKHS